MDMERRPRYPENFLGNDYTIIENLLSGRESNGSDNMGTGNGCGCRNNNTAGNSGSCHEHEHGNNGCGHEHEHEHGNNGCGHEHEHEHSNSGCGHEHEHEHGKCPTAHFPDNIHLAMVYSPDHEFDNMYSPEEGFEAGTIFKGLDKPFGGRTMSGGKCR